MKTRLVILSLSFCLLYLVNASAATSANAFVCHGTEPFWRLDISPEKIVYNEMSLGNVPMQTVTPRAAEGHAKDYVLVYQTAALMSNQPVSLVLHRDEGGCSDGMSDQSFEYDVTVIFPKRVMTGCCKLQ